MNDDDNYQGGHPGEELGDGFGRAFDQQSSTARFKAVRRKEEQQAKPMEQRVRELEEKFNNITIVSNTPEYIQISGDPLKGFVVSLAGQLLVDLTGEHTQSS